jgi:hypothetical protein
MASPFLENLKKSVEEGDFNSEAAKKIIEVDKLATEKNGSTPALNAIFNKIDSTPSKPAPTEEEVLELNSAYEKEMQEIRDKDLVLQQIATLRDIEETVRLSVMDMKGFIQTLEVSFDKTKPVNAELFAEIEQIKTKYNSIINN